jgi:hypothetical protein
VVKLETKPMHDRRCSTVFVGTLTKLSILVPLARAWLPTARYTPVRFLVDHYTLSLILARVFLAYGFVPHRGFD